MSMFQAFGISIGFPIFVLLVMLFFGLYNRRNIGWVVLCLLWGITGYWIASKLNPMLLDAGVSFETVIVIFVPIIQQILVSIGVIFVLSWKKFDNLIDGAVYGWAAGTGFAIFTTLEYVLAASRPLLELALARSFSSTLVFATAAAMTGLIMNQFYFRHRANRAIILLSGLGAAIGHNALFNFLTLQNLELVFPVAYSIGGLTLMSLYITGQLRKILIQVGIEKRRADGLLEIVIPIGVDLASEKNFQKLLERMLVEAKNFCRADAGTLYLKKNDMLEFAVVRNDALNIAMGGTSGQEVTLPPIRLHDEAGNPNHKHIASYAALTGKSINIDDAYENKEFDFSGTRKFDEQTGYMSVSFLTIPLKDSKGEVQGVLQLLNALDKGQKTIIPFDKNLQQLMESFSSLASAALEGYIHEQKLRKEIQQLRIEIDMAKRDKQVAEITDTGYFRELKERAQGMRNRKKEEK